MLPPPGRIQNYCAPDQEAQESFRQSKTCFTLSSLRKLARAWNEKHTDSSGNTITGILTKTKHELWTTLNARLKSKCSGIHPLGKEGCWIDHLRMGEQSEPFQDMRYPKPADWYKNPRKWLNNFNIEDVMEQYENEPSHHYHFLGVYPMDFADIYTELNDLRWAHLTKGDACKYVGMITNLDEHDEPGSHWTSFFAVLDPKMPSFGAYYYDSVSMPPTTEIKTFMIKLMVKTLSHYLQPLISADDLHRIMSYPFIKYNGVEVKAFTKQLNAIVKPYSEGGNLKTVLPYPFKLEYNTHQHQYKNTECGVFSMVYQIRWLEGLKKDPTTTFDRVVQHRMRDDEIHWFRDFLFRPNATVNVN